MLLNPTTTFTLHRWAALLLMAVVITCVGCQDKHVSLAGDSIELMNDLASAVEGLSADTLTQTTAEIEVLENRSRTIREQLESLGGEPGEEIAEKISAKYGTTIESLKPRFRQLGPSLEAYPELRKQVDAIVQNAAPLDLKGPYRQGFQEVAPQKGPEELIKTIEQAAMVYKLDHGQFPSELAALSVAPDEDSTRWRGPYLKEPVTADPWGTAFRFSVEGNNRVVIISAGRDKEFGTEDDITN